jgi:transposase
MSHSEAIQTDVDDGQRRVRIPDPEVEPRPERRQYSAGYKLRVLEEADQCTERGQVGALLRREGLYSSLLSKWRMQRAGGQLQALSPKKRGCRPADPAVVEVARLRQEIERLQARLEKAELIIEVQKKLSQLLGLTPGETETDESKR